MEFIDKVEFLKDVKSNIVKWYDFKDTANLLEIGSGLEEITETLCTKLSKVVWITNSNTGVKNYDNLEIINDNIENINLEEKFDYILIKDDIKKLGISKRFLKPDGTILLIINNKFGIANFAGADKFKSIYEDKSDLLSKNEIEKILKQENFLNYKFFYPLPNYEATNVIFSDDYLPDYTDTKLMCNNIYEEKTDLVFDELQALKQLTKDGQFKNFTNSYFIEINPKIEIKFASFNNPRKKQYRLCTKIYENNAIKIATNEEAKKHILNMKKYIEDFERRDIKIIDKFEEDKIISQYVKQKTVYKIIIENIQNNNIDYLYELMQRWYDFIKSKFENEKTDILNENIKDINCDFINELFIVKNAYIDLVFENAFLIDNEFVFFDQEWCIENLPLEFILYRAINNIYIYHSELENILPKKNIFDKFNLSKYLELFENIEKVVQNIIIDKNINDIYENSKNIIKDLSSIQKLIEDNQNLINQINLLNEEEAKKENYIEELTSKLGKAYEENDGLKQEDKRKEEYILSLQEQLMQKDEIINKLNEIIKVKDNQISIYENMRAVKIAKKLRGLK